MRTRFLLAVAAGAFLLLGGTASAQFRDYRYDGYRFDRRCAERIRELERNVAKYERDRRWRDAQLERQKLAETRANCSYYYSDNRGYSFGNRGRDRGCERRIEALERNVRKFEQRFGYYSRQARHEREKLREARRSCGFDSGGYWHWHDGDDRWDRDRDRDRDRNRRDWRRDHR
jgi:hypothetical protein